MNKDVDLKSFEKFSDILDKESPIEERVAKLSSKLKDINFRPNLIDLFNVLKQEEDFLISSYNSISGEIKLEISNLLDSINSLRAENLGIELELASLQSNFKKYRNLYEKIPISEAEKTSNEYMKFLKIYENMNDLSKKVLDKKHKIEKFLNLQKILDSTFSSEIIEIEYLIGKLNLLINNFGSFKTPELLKAYILKFSRKTDLEKLIFAKEDEFEKMKIAAKESIEKDSLVLDKTNLFDSDKLSSLKTSKITKDLFILEK